MIIIEHKTIERIIIREFSTTPAQKCAKIFHRLGVTKEYLLKVDKKCTGKPISFTMSKILNEMEKING